MQKGLFAKYNASIYKAELLSNNLVKLVSRNSMDTASGFKLKKYPEFYKDRDNLPKIYLKEVKRDELDELFEINPKAEYKGLVFNLSSEKNGQVYIGTTDATKAKNLGFERTDKYYYEKWVPEEEVKIIEERIDIEL